MWRPSDPHEPNPFFRETIKTCDSDSKSTLLDDDRRHYVPGITSHSRPRLTDRHAKRNGADSHSYTRLQSHTRREASNSAHPHRHSVTTPQRTLGEWASPNAFVGHMTKSHFIEIVASSLHDRAEYNSQFVALPTYSEPESVFFSVSRPDIPTKDYITRLVTYTQCSASAFVVMLIYLDRISVANMSLHITPYNMHRLLVTALTLACKVLDDRCFSNVHYAKVGGIPTVREMNRLELQFLTYLNFRLHVTPAKYEEKVRMLESSPPTSPISVECGNFGSPVTITSTMGKDDVQSFYSSGTSSSVSVSNGPRQSDRAECTYGPGVHLESGHFPGHSGKEDKWLVSGTGRPPPSLLPGGTY